MAIRSAPAPAFRVTREETTHDGVTVMTMQGEIDYVASPQLRERIFGHINAGRRRLVLDLSAVTFIDTMALGVIVAAVMRLRAREANGSLSVVCPEGDGSLSVVCQDERVRRTFRISGLDAGVGFYGSREQAVSELAHAAC
ncbi:MAG TPA: STAS domain-containing protein [Solirubrobacteraceae bacterium]|jgi:anti-anti-sigma factor|nr:STAS domain-containing protein [Solirubrobacteraceae bacterium]